MLALLLVVVAGDRDGGEPAAGGAEEEEEEGGCIGGSAGSAGGSAAAAAPSAPFSLVRHTLRAHVHHPLARRCWRTLRTTAVSTVPRACRASTFWIGASEAPEASGAR